MDEMLHALDQRGGKLGKRGGRFPRGMQFEHSLHDVRNRTTHRRRDGELIGNEVRRGLAFGGDDADAELFFSKEQRHDFDFAPPGGIIPTVGRDKQDAARPQAKSFNFATVLDLIFIRAPERNFQSRKGHDMAEEGRVQLALADENPVYRAPGEIFRPPVQWNGRLHTGLAMLK